MFQFCSSVLYSPAPGWGVHEELPGLHRQALQGRKSNWTLKKFVLLLKINVCLQVEQDLAMGTDAEGEFCQISYFPHITSKSHFCGFFTVDLLNLLLYNFLILYSNQEKRSATTWGILCRSSSTRMSPSTTRSGLTIQRKKKKHRITTQDHPAVHPIEERDQRGELDQVDPARSDSAREDLHHQVEKEFCRMWGRRGVGRSLYLSLCLRNMANMGVNVVVDVSIIAV